MWNKNSIQVEIHHNFPHISHKSTTYSKTILKCKQLVSFPNQRELIAPFQGINF